MSNYILKYSRGGEVKYISHLDFVRMFHRAVRRAGLPMSYSKGFNPHPVMTVAMPLSVGVTSDGEYLKIGFEGEFSEAEIKEALNRALPKGFLIKAAAKADGKDFEFSKLDRAEYIVTAELSEPYAPDIGAFFRNGEILVMKKSKSGVREADIKPYIYEMEIMEIKGNIITFFMRIAAGNNYNLKPETVLDALSKYQDGFKPVFAAVHRQRILAGEEEYLK